jgi:glycosyltransferase involved in cell wall biosynthesis
MVKFSVIIPTHNRPHFLAEAVSSVLSQSETDLELIIVNDGDALTKQYDDARIKILDNQHRGAVAARNFAIANAIGNYIAFLDDDDVWITPQHLKNAGDILSSGNAFCFADGTMQFEHEAAPRIFSENANLSSLRRDNTILISAVCYHRSLHADLGLFDETLPYYWDWDWYLRVAASGFDLKHIKSLTVEIRIHPQNMSGNTNTLARQNNLHKLAAKHNLAKLTLKNHTDFAR